MRIGQVVAPAMLFVSVAVVATLMFAPPSFLQSIGLDLARSTQAGSFDTTRSIAPTETRAPRIVQHARGWTAAPGLPPLTIDDLLLIERAESMLEQGDIAGARRELAEAAAAGNVHARFALAETFDPNMLAARGLRMPVADAGTARALYSQALTDGDDRARRRIDGLK